MLCEVRRDLRCCVRLGGIPKMHIFFMNKFD